MMPAMRSFSRFGIALGSLVVLPFANLSWAAAPDVICQLQRQTQIDPSTFAGTISTPSETYKIKNGKLYISNQERTEGYYNDVREIEFGRYASGHKTLIFVGDVSAGTSRMLAFHSHELDIRVSEFSCRKW
jgi:hypothetical protein